MRTVHTRIGMFEHKVTAVAFHNNFSKCLGCQNFLDSKVFMGFLISVENKTIFHFLPTNSTLRSILKHSATNTSGDFMNH